MPIAFCGPAGLMTDPTEIDTLVIKCSGFQFMSAILRIICAANLGDRRGQDTSAAGRLQADRLLSIVGSVVS